MKQYMNLIQRNRLFDGVSFSEFHSMLQCLNAKEYNYKKNEVIVFTGNVIDFVGLVLSGSVKIIKEDRNGNDLLLSEIGVGELFGEAFACAGILSSPVTIISNDNTKVLLFDYHKIITTCQRSCIFHAKLIENMLKIIAHKNLLLNQKIEVIGKRSLREKLLCYLEYERKGAMEFRISLNREELASYLCADRSAVSNELSKMQRDGLIRYHKNQFVMWD